MYFAPQAGHAPHLVPLEWADRYKGVFDAGYEAMRPEILARQIELGLLPEGTELSGINPHGEPNRTGPNGEPWPLLDTVRPWETLSDDEKRLFVRMAEVFAGYISYYDDRLGPDHRLPRAGRRARQHDHRRRLRQRVQRRGRPERHVQRVALLQRHRRHHRPRARAHRRARHAGVEQPLQHRLGVGAGHAVPVLEAVGRLRGRHRRHVPRVLAGEDRRRATRCGTSTCTRSTSSRRCTTCSASRRPRSSTGTSRSRSRARASPPP